MAVIYLLLSKDSGKSKARITTLTFFRACLKYSVAVVEEALWTWKPRWRTSVRKLPLSIFFVFFFVRVLIDSFSVDAEDFGFGTPLNTFCTSRELW